MPSYVYSIRAIAPDGTGQQVLTADGDLYSSGPLSPADARTEALGTVLTAASITRPQTECRISHFTYTEIPAN